jgi:hypothetical protein
LAYSFGNLQLVRNPGFENAAGNRTGGRLQIFGERFCSYVGVKYEIEAQLGDSECLPSHHHPRFGMLWASSNVVCWHL